VGRIEDKFDQLRSRGAKAFMPFVTACDPSPEASAEIVLALEKAGADIVELGFAYTDPIADGPVIQDSYAKVLGAGRTVADALGVVREIRRRSSIPLAGMVSYSIVWKKGPAEFTRAAAEAGLDALIVPDLPPEEAGDLLPAAEAAGVPVVFLVTPNTRGDRLAAIVEASRPFIYYVSVVGTTGARQALPAELAEGVKAVKSMTGKPVVVGFGVSTPAQAAAVSRIADGVIVGSAIVEVIAAKRGASVESLSKAVRDFASPIAKAVKV
jgi:tryptophan synthase alpha chain